MRSDTCPPCVLCVSVHTARDEILRSCPRTPRELERAGFVVVRWFWKDTQCAQSFEPVAGQLLASFARQVQRTLPLLGETFASPRATCAGLGIEPLGVRHAGCGCQNLWVAVQSSNG